MGEACKTVVIAAVPFSDNLGDGLIALNLDSMLRRMGVDNVRLCDISYRRAIPFNKSKGSGLFEIYLAAPHPVRQAMVMAIFGMKYLLGGRAHLRRTLGGADRVLVGGGQLLSDVDANFPFKLWLLTIEAERSGVPIYITSVGVASRWSWLGRRLIRKVLRSPALEAISVRDEVSRANLTVLDPTLDPVILPDPALMSAELVKLRRKNQAQPVQFALGVASIKTLNHSSDLANADAGNSLDDLALTVRLATEAGYEVRLFTNGAAEDEAFLHGQLAPDLTRRGLKFSVEPRFSQPSDLADFIAGATFLVAYRLHANITASALGVRSLAVAWDGKVRAFFNLMGRPEDVFDDLATLNVKLPQQLADGLAPERPNINELELLYARFLKL